MNTRQKATSDILNKAVEDGGIEQIEVLEAALKRLSDTNLFALYVDIFGYPVGEEVRS